MVLQAADVWYLNDRAAGWRLCSPRDRRIFVQREVRAPLVIPHEPVGSCEAEPFWRGPLEDGELMAQRQDLHFEFSPRSQAGANDGKEGSDARGAYWCTLSAETGKLNRHKKYGVSGSDNWLRSGLPPRSSAMAGRFHLDTFGLQLMW